MVTPPILWQNSQEMPSAASPVKYNGLTPSGTWCAFWAVTVVWQPDHPQLESLGFFEASGV